MKSEMVWTRTLIYTLVAVLAAQLKLSAISGDFIISIGVIVLALFTWFDESMPVKRVIVISAVGIFLTRILRLCFILSMASVLYIFSIFIAEIIIYLYI